MTAGWASAATVPRSGSGTSGWRMVKRADMRARRSGRRRLNSGGIGAQCWRQRGRRSPSASAAPCRPPRRGAAASRGDRSEGAVERDGIGIDQQLVGIEAMACRDRRGRRRAGHSARPAQCRRRTAVMDVVARRAVELEALRSRDPASSKSETQMRLARLARCDREVDAVGGDRRAQRIGARADPARGVNRMHRSQVMTLGSSRPVRFSIPADSSATAIRSASAACVSRPCLAGSGS